MPVDTKSPSFTSSTTYSDIKDGEGGEAGKKLKEMTVLPKPTSAATPTFPISHTLSLFLPWTNR